MVSHRLSHQEIHHQSHVCEQSHAFEHHSTFPLSNAVIEKKLAAAKQTCAAQGIRFTPLREQVFRLILQAEKPIGAYDLLAQLQKTSEKTLAPPTIYRSLDFLLANGFIHQLSSSNAFFPCCQPEDQHLAAFLICQQCGDVQEFSHPSLNNVIQDVAVASKFKVNSSVIELLGLCQHCQP